jgi:cysteine synthase A
VHGVGTAASLRGVATRRIAREESLFAGTSSGANVVAALGVAQRLGPGAKVVTVMADSGLKYLSTDVYRRR